MNGDLAKSDILIKLGLCIRLCGYVNYYMRHKLNRVDVIRQIEDIRFNFKVALSLIDHLEDLHLHQDGKKQWDIGTLDQTIMSLIEEIGVMYMIKGRLKELWKPNEVKLPGGIKSKVERLKINLLILGKKLSVKPK